MSIDTNKLINVLNYNFNQVAIKTHLNEYLCASAESEDYPSINPLNFSEIEYLNSNTNAFKIGILMFPKEIEAEMYEKLRIVDWKNILTNSQIKDIILHPTAEGLSKLVEIKNSSLFERVRGIFFSLKNANEHDISIRVEKIVVRRYKELVNQQIKSSIEVKLKDTIPTVTTEEVDNLKEQNQAMQTQMETMQKMMEQMMAMQSANLVQPEVKVETKEVVTKPTNSKPSAPASKAKVTK